MNATKTQLTDEIKRMIQLNAASADFQSMPGEFGKNEAGQWSQLIDWDNLPERYINLCNENMNIVSKLIEARNKRPDILVGDFLRMPDGSMSRVTYCYDDGVQDGGGSGSFFLFPSGQASYSGGLNGCKSFDKINPTNETKPALFWTWSRGCSGANRSFHFYADVKIWQIDDMFKTAFVKFPEWKYNYHTNINGKLSDEEIKKYFVGQWFNLGSGENDNMQQCTDVAIYY